MEYLYITGTIVFTVYGQLAIKWRIGNYGALPDSFFDKLFFLFKVCLDPYIFSGLFAAVLASFFWLAAMTKFDVSYAYPLITAGLTVLTVSLAMLFLGEAFSFQKIAGIFIIIGGVLVMGIK
jgi:multidrug transporter EmrE-like cation transporter